jgi:hypothetical protein
MAQNNPVNANVTTPTVAPSVSTTA